MGATFKASVPGFKYLNFGVEQLPRPEKLLDSTDTEKLLDIIRVHLANLELYIQEVQTHQSDPETSLRYAIASNTLAEIILSTTIQLTILTDGLNAYHYQSKDTNTPSTHPPRRFQKVLSWMRTANHSTKTTPNDRIETICNNVSVSIKKLQEYIDFLVSFSKDGEAFYISKARAIVAYTKELTAVLSQQYETTR